MRCPKCSRENPGQARYCRACGERLAGAELRPDAPQLLTPEERSRRLLEDAFRLSEEGRFQSAISSCQQAIALNPTSTSAHSLLGTLYERIGDRDGAIRAYEQVLTLSPGSTVERRRLNELMGVSAAAEQAAVSPRTARMAVTGGFVVIALVLVGAIIFTTQQPRQPAGGQVVRRPAAVARETDLAPASATETAPPRLLGSGRIRSAPAPAPRRPSAPARAERAQQPQTYGGQYLGPGAYLLPSGGPEPYAGMGAGARRSYRPPPIEGAIPIRPGTSPAVSTPYWGYPSRAAAPPGTANVARNYYLEGDYQRSIDAYRNYIARNPRAPEPRDELAWVYTEAGDRQAADREYRVALDQYRADLDRGHNPESARHGVRTCESAIRALETE